MKYVGHENISTQSGHGLLVSLLGRHGVRHVNHNIAPYSDRTLSNVYLLGGFLSVGAWWNMDSYFEARTVL